MGDNSHPYRLKQMKILTALAALTLITAPAAHAQWGGGAPQSAAAAYCASRAAGNSHNKADKDARWMLSGGMQGGFASNMATVLTSGRQMMQTTGYMAKQMCPEHFGSTSASTISVDEAAATALSWGEF